jgi:hypothetical protein
MRPTRKEGKAAVRLIKEASDICYENQQKCRQKQET